MQTKFRTAFLVIVTLLATGWYFAEPWALTFVDDGPYFSESYSGLIDDLPVHSSVQLRRFGSTVFTLESRLLQDGDESVLLLWDRSGHLTWARIVIKPDGELGSLRFREPHLTWNGGWRIRIIPSNQEPGDLYLSAFGGFRFLNHSW